MNRNFFSYTLLFIIFNSFCFCSKSTKTISKSDIESYDKINIQFVDFELLTPIDVRCNLFNSFFSEDQIKYIEFNDTLKINEFREILSTLTLLSPEFNKNIDTRAKIQIILPSDTIFICADSFALEMEGNVYYTPQSLVSFIENFTTD